MNTDLPYLEPLLFWLQDDPVLKSEFTQSSFFMPHTDLITATEEAMKKDCPAPRALWILPQDTLSGPSKPNCKSYGVHTFYIEVIVQCIRDPFVIRKNDAGFFLDGQAMELAKIRKMVKESVFRFVHEYKKKTNPALYKFDDFNWIKDQMLYPGEGMKFLATAMEFTVKIF